jgi:hypothetical protein
MSSRLLDWGVEVATVTLGAMQLDLRPSDPALGGPTRPHPWPHPYKYEQQLRFVHIEGYSMTQNNIVHSIGSQYLQLEEV